MMRVFSTGIRYLICAIIFGFAPVFAVQAKVCFLPECASGGGDNSASANFGNKNCDGYTLSAAKGDGYTCTSCTNKSGTKYKCTAKVCNAEGIDGIRRLTSPINKPHFVCRVSCQSGEQKYYSCNCEAGYKLVKVTENSNNIITINTASSKCEKICLANEEYDAGADKCECVYGTSRKYGDYGPCEKYPDKCTADMTYDDTTNECYDCRNYQNRSNLNLQQLTAQGKSYRACFTGSSLYCVDDEFTRYDGNNSTCITSDSTGLFAFSDGTKVCDDPTNKHVVNNDHCECLPGKYLKEVYKDGKMYCKEQFIYVEVDRYWNTDTPLYNLEVTGAELTEERDEYALYKFVKGATITLNLTDGITCGNYYADGWNTHTADVLPKQNTVTFTLTDDNVYDLFGTTTFYTEDTLPEPDDSDYSYYYSYSTLYPKRPTSYFYSDFEDGTDICTLVKQIKSSVDGIRTDYRIDANKYTVVPGNLNAWHYHSGSNNPINGVYDRKYFSTSLPQGVTINGYQWYDYDHASSKKCFFEIDVDNIPRQLCEQLLTFNWTNLTDFRGYSFGTDAYIEDVEACRNSSNSLLRVASTNGGSGGSTYVCGSISFTFSQAQALCSACGNSGSGRCSMWFGFE